MKIFVLITFMSFGSIAWSQDAAEPFGSKPPTKSDDPFGGGNSKAAGGADPFGGFIAEPKAATYTSGKPFHDPFDVKAEEGYGEMDAYAEGSGMYGMEMGYDSSEGLSPDDRFRIGLQHAITALKKAGSDEEKKALQGFIVKAFSDRYDRMIANRKKDLERLKKQIASLEQDLSRREAAKSRVIQVQLQSVQLAAEGLLELNELQGVPSQSGGMMEEGMSAMGMGR